MCGQVCMSGKLNTPIARQMNEIEAKERLVIALLLKVHTAWIGED